MAGRILTLSIGGALLAAMASLTGCTKQPQPDAYGNVEAIDVVVGAQAGGQLLAFEPVEGAALAASAVVGAIDSVELGLQREQATAQRLATASRGDELARQMDVVEAQRRTAAAERDAAVAQAAALDAQLDIARRAHDRTTRLFDQKAATTQQLEQTERDVRVLEQQIAAQRNRITAATSQVETQTRQGAMLRAQQQSVNAQVKSADAQVAQLGERLRKTEIVNPTAGTVLATYVRAGEVVQSGQPLYKIADLSSVDVRAYITEPQLAAVKLGAPAQVTIDVGKDSRRTLTGSVTWVASEAEFTPTPIQTREERTGLVYAVKIRVKNDNGALKIGMPADVQFGAEGGAQ